LGLGWFIIQSRTGRPAIPRDWLVAALVLAAVTGVGWAIAALRSARDKRWVARRIEAKYPDLATGLLAAVEEDASSPPGRLGYLQTVVIRKALAHRRAHDWTQTVSPCSRRFYDHLWRGCLVGQDRTGQC
jgi:hypothetical protein